MLIFAINKALKKPSPDRIPLSSPRALKNDFSSVTLEDPENESRALIRKRAKEGYEATVWEKGNPSVLKVLGKDEIRKLKPGLRITRYFRGYEFEYNSAAAFIIMEFIGWRWIIKGLAKANQSIYNRKRLVREERIALLRHLVERKLEDPSDEINTIMLAVQRYSPKWLHHPDKDRHKSHLKLVLDSFLKSGELEKKGGNYVVTPNAIITLSNHELTMQQHKDQISVAKSANILTLAIIAIGLAGILFSP